MIVPPDYYQTLSIKKNATDAEIRLAYRKLALKVKSHDQEPRTNSSKHHPERNSAAGTKEKFSAIAEAFDVLSDGNYFSFLIASHSVSKTKSYL